MLRACLMLAVVLFPGTAGARPPENADPALSPWFQGLRQPRTGTSCCSIADCRATDFRQTGDSYDVLIDEKFGISPPRWLSVPPERILSDTGNPTGSAVVCYTPALGIMCFVRPPEA